MADDGTTTAHNAAQAMLDAFASVGAASFNLTWTNSTGEPRRSRKGVSLAELARAMPGMLDRAIANRLNLIVRPYGSAVAFIQLDDLTAEKLPRIAPARFLTIQTSPGSYQAWLAVPGSYDKEFARRVRRGAGADLTASGATRVAGSLNYKEKYAPDFPRVSIRETAPGRKVTAAELEQLGLVSAPDNFAPLPPALSASPYRWPSYAETLAGAPGNRAGDGPDRSKADFVWCMTAISWGYGVEDTAARLLIESQKAREEGKSYADGTAKNAAQAVEKRRRPARAAIIGHQRS
jgi:RepB DNA-primase from phage plasmid